MTKKRIFREGGLYEGRMISGSKSGYRHDNPNNDIMFNANIFIKDENGWHGDLDITKDKTKLQEICDKFNKELIIVEEMLGRFGAEERDYDVLREDAHAIFFPHQEEYLSRVYDGIKPVKIDNMTIVTGKGVDWKKISSYEK